MSLTPKDGKDIRQDISAYVRSSIAVKSTLEDQSSEIAAIIDKLEQVARVGGTIYSCGNGGSACDSIHLTEELVARYQIERPGIRAHHFQDPGILTCWSNDYEFAGVFERQVKTMLNAADALVAITTSGNSENILRAIKAANELGATTIALLGKGGGKAKSLAKHSLVVKSDITSHVQEAHITVIHVICDQLERRLFASESL